MLTQLKCTVRNDTTGMDQGDTMFSAIPKFFFKRDLELTIEGSWPFWCLLVIVLSFDLSLLVSLIALIAKAR
jgi:hypothetical protein